MPAVNIASQLSVMAERSPDQLAVLFPSSRDGSGKTVYVNYSYRRLEDESNRVAAGLDSIGIRRGTRTVLMVPPSIEFFLLTFALFKSGAIPVLVDPGMGIKNLGKCLVEAEPHAFIGVTKAHIARILFGWGKSTLKTLVTVGRRWGWGGYELKSLSRTSVAGNASTDTKANHRRPAETDAEDTAAILFTSGSTGVPKGAVYSHGNFASQVAALQKTFAIQPGEIDLCTFPLFALFAPALGMTAIVPRMDFTQPARVSPREIDEPIRAFGVNNLFGSPALLNRVGRELCPAGSNQGSNKPDTGRATKVWPTVRRVLSAGAPVSPAILERFSQLLPGGSQIFTPYGATESLPVAVIGSDEVLSETRQKTAEGAGTCVGRPVDTIEVRIIRITEEPIAEWSEELCLPRGEIGEIVVNGPMVTQSYYNRPDLTAIAKVRDPQSGRMRHRMGDVGYFDERGRLWFCGRKSHRVVTEERSYFTEPVEGVFNTHPAVFRTALVGVHRGGRLEPVLCVEREPDAKWHRMPNEALVSQLREIGAKFEHTRSIQTFLFHNRFPVDIRHNSKIFREKLAVWAAKQI